MQGAYVSAYAPFAFGEGSPTLKYMPRKKIPPDIRSLCRSYTSETIMRLAAIMRNPGKEEPASTSVAAGRVLLSYGWGAPAQPLTGEDGEGAIEITFRHITEGKR